MRGCGPFAVSSRTNGLRVCFPRRRTNQHISEMFVEWNRGAGEFCCEVSPALTRLFGPYLSSEKLPFESRFIVVCSYVLIFYGNRPGHNLDLRQAVDPISPPPEPFQQSCVTEGSISPLRMRTFAAERFGWRRWVLPPGPTSVSSKASVPSPAVRQANHR